MRFLRIFTDCSGGQNVKRILGMVLVQWSWFRSTFDGAIQHVSIRKIWNSRGLWSDWFQMFPRSETKCLGPDS